MISIIIVTYNSHPCLPDCLQSIYQSKLTEAFNIIIVDNASRDKNNTHHFIKTLGHDNIVFLENQENVGFAKAANQGLQYAKETFVSDYYLLLNPDATLDMHCLDHLVTYAESHEKTGLLTALIIQPKDNSVWFSHGHIDWLGMKALHSPTAPLQPNPILQTTRQQKHHPTSYLTGCCLLIKREIIENIGLFDERFFLYYEDADYSVRVQQAGYDITTVKKAACYHNESQSSDPTTKNYHLVKSGLLFFHKHLPLYLKPHFWLFYSLRRGYHQFLSGKKEVLQAMKDFRKEYPKSLLG